MSAAAATASSTGLAIRAVQDVIRIGLGGPTLTRTVEGRERYPVRVRFMREERDSVEALAGRGDEVRILDSFDPYYDPQIKRRTAAVLCERASVSLVELAEDLDCFWPRWPLRRR